MSGKYDDIIDLPHPSPKTHSRMPRLERAAQFAPFAALSGYEAVIREAERLTTQRRELDEDRKQELNEVLQRIRDQIRWRPRVRVTWFVPDGLKVGGEYVTRTVTVRRVDRSLEALELEDRSLIPIPDITELELLDQIAEPPTPQPE